MLLSSLMFFDTNFVATRDAQAADGSTATPQLEAALKLLLEGDFQSRWEATKQLPTLGKIAIAHLVHLLEDEDLDWEVRWFAARTLGNFDDPEALASLVRLLEQTREPELIAIAAEGLSRFGAAGITALVQLFNNPYYRVTAIQALASIRHKDTLPPLLTAAQDANPEVRRVALAALGCFRDPRVDRLLIQIVEDPVVAVRREAITHLGLRQHLLATVDLVTVLQPSLGDVSLEVSQAAAIALGRLGSEAAIAYLARTLQSPHTPEPLQAVIVRALSWSDQETALAALLSVHAKVSLPIQLEIIEALPRLEAPRLRQQASEALCDWLTSLLDNSQAIAVKQAIALALGDLHPPQAKSLLQTLTQDPNEQTVLYAEAALRQIANSG